VRTPSNSHHSRGLDRFESRLPLACARRIQRRQIWSGSFSLDYGRNTRKVELNRSLSRFLSESIGGIAGGIVWPATAQGTGPGSPGLRSKAIGREASDTLMSGGCAENSQKWARILRTWIFSSLAGSGSRAGAIAVLPDTRVHPDTAGPPGGAVQPLPGSRRDAARSNASTDVTPHSGMRRYTRGPLRSAGIANLTLAELRATLLLHHVRTREGSKVTRNRCS
jgi:hypothetical protein